MSEKKIDLIAQLLAKAESTTPEEAEALTEAAEKMMAKYMIDQATIDARRAKKGEASEKVIQIQIQFTGAYRGELLNLASRVTNSLGTLRMLQSTTWNKGKTFVAYIIGFESDVAQAKLLIESLEVQAAIAVRAWWKENKDSYSFLSTYEQEKERRSFVHGFGSGAGDRIWKNRNQIVEEATAGTALVLVSRKDKVNDWVDEQYAGTLKSSRGRNATGGGAAGGAGFRAGQNANTGERAVSQGRGIGA
jgi:hypothetical protein